MKRLMMVIKTWDEFYDGITFDPCASTMKAHIVNPATTKSWCGIKSGEIEGVNSGNIGYWAHTGWLCSKCHASWKERP